MVPFGMEGTKVPLNTCEILGSTAAKLIEKQIAITISKKAKKN